MSAKREPIARASHAMRTGMSALRTARLPSHPAPIAAEKTGPGSAARDFQSPKTEPAEKLSRARQATATGARPTFLYSTKTTSPLIRAACKRQLIRRTEATRFADELND